MIHPNDQIILIYIVKLLFLEDTIRVLLQSNTNWGGHLTFKPMSEVNNMRHCQLTKTFWAFSYILLLMAEPASRSAYSAM